MQKQLLLHFLLLQADEKVKNFLAKLDTYQYNTFCLFGCVAQLVERSVHTRYVESSTLPAATMIGINSSIG